MQTRLSDKVQTKYWKLLKKSYTLSKYTNYS